MESRADVLLGGRLGQAMLADLAGLDSLVLLAAEGKPPPAGVAFLESSSSSDLSALLRWSRRPRRAHRDAGTWRSVAAQWDGVHVSVAGYLSTARMAVDIGGGAATLLAGWDADQTL